MTLIVSKGANLITVPELVGSRRRRRRLELEELGLIPNVDTQDADEPEGKVIDQEPAAGADGSCAATR